MRISDWSSDVCSSDLLELGRAGVYALEDGADAQLVTKRAHLLFGDTARHRLYRIMDDARSARLCACVQMIVAMSELGGFERKLRQPLVGKAHSIPPPAHPRALGQDRKSVVYGTGVEVGVNPVGRSILKN